jgi:hypothetical protein
MRKSQMMKTLLASAAIATLIAGQAFAASGPGIETFNTPGVSGPSPTTDGVGQWYISGSAASYCVIGKAGLGNGDAGQNVTINTTSTGVAGDTRNGNSSDGLITITQLQGPNDQANAWAANIVMPNSICNSPYTISVVSANRGLTSSVTSANTAFATKLDYAVSVNFDGQTGSLGAAGLGAGAAPLVTSTDASVGNFTLDLRGQASTQLLLAGTYTDNVLVTMSPNLGGAHS